MKVLLTVCALLFSGLVAAAPLNNIVVFGDSLSDNGNFYEFMKHRLPQSPPYYQGRFTNGPVWIERLASSYFPNNPERLLDYAFGGAGVSGEGNDDALFTLKNEINSYLLAHQNKADPQNLFVLWIGSNNYLFLPENEKQAVREVNNGIKDGLDKLVNSGAKHILVLNLADLGKAPVARIIDAEVKLSSLVKQHNQQFVATMHSLKKRYPTVQWLYFNIHDSINELLTSPERYGFNNTTDACVDMMLTNDDLVGKSLPHQLLQTTANMKKTLSDDACQGYLFFDAVHPTAPAHQIMAERARAVLDASGIEFNP